MSIQSLSVVKIMESIRYNHGTYPRKELEEIVKRKEEAVPYLLELLQQVANEPETFRKDWERMDFLYAILILAQFRVSEAFSYFLQSLQLPDNIADELYDNFVTEGSGRALASMYGGMQDLDRIFDLVDNASVNEYVRSAGVQALAVLVHEGQVERGIIQIYFKDLLRGDLDDNGGVVYSSIVNYCLELNFIELKEDIKAAYDKGRIDKMIVAWQDVQEHLAFPAVRNNNPHITMINNVHDEVSWWACFKDAVKRSVPVPLKLEQPYIKQSAVGRNDPCICGSGKKYKKCCGK